MADLSRNVITVFEVKANQAISEARRYEKAIRDANVASASAAKGTANFSQAITANAKQLNTYRRYIGQASFQIADFAIVMQQGQSAVRALAVQGGQLLGAFGPMGAVLGGIVTVGGLLVHTFIEARDSAASYAKAIADAEKSTAALVKETARLERGVSKEIFEIESAIAEAKGEAADAEERLARARGQSQKGARINLKLAQEEVKRLEEILTKRVEAEQAAQRTKERLEEQSVVLNNQLLISQALADIDGARLQTHQQLLETLTAQGQAMMNNIRANPDFFDPRGESSGAGNADFTYQDAGLPPVTLPPNPTFKKPGRGGGGGSKEIDDQRRAIEQLIPQVQKAVAEYETWDQVLRRDLHESMTTMIVDQGIGGFVDAIFEADQSFSEFARNFLKNIAKMILETLILKALTGGLGGGGGLSGGFLGQVLPFAKGGVIGSPVAFPMGSAGKVGIAGESGPEAIMPLSRGADGRLGVSGPNIQVNNYTGQEVRVTRSDNELITIAVGQAVQASQAEFAAQMSSGHGTYAQSMENSYHAKRRAY